MTNVKAPADMNAREALLAYGYQLSADGIFTVKTGALTQVWKPVDGGWTRLDPPTAPMGDLSGGDPTLGAPWGRPLEGTSWIQVPWKQSERFASASGLHPASHPECFEWVWPDAVVAEIYAYAYTGEDGFGKQYHRNDKGELVAGRGKEREDGPSAQAADKP